MNIQKIVLVLWGVSVSGVGFTQTPLRLGDAIKKGLENNFQIKAAEQNEAAAQNNDDWGIAGRFPVVTASVNFNNGYTNNNNPASFLTELSSFSFGLTPAVDANFVLFDGYRVRITKEQLSQQVALEKGNLQTIVETSIQAIVNAYFSAALQQEQIKTLGELLRLSRDRIAYQKIRQEYGQARSFDLIQFETAYLTDTTNYMLASTNYQNAIRNLNLAIGEPDVEKQYTLTDALAFEPKAYSMQTLEEKMLASNPTLQLQKIRRELAAVNTRLQETTLFPRVTARAGVSYGGTLSSGSGTLASGNSLSLDAVLARSLNLNVGFTASYTLFDWGVRNKRIQTARLQENAAQFTVENSKLTLVNQLHRTHATYLNQLDLVQVTSTLVDLAETNMSIAEERYKGGLITSLDYRNVQLGYINAIQSRLNAIYNVKITETELARLTGGLIR